MYTFGFPSGIIRYNWNDTEKFSMAPAQGWHAQIEKCKHYFYAAIMEPKTCKDQHNELASNFDLLVGGSSQADHLMRNAAMDDSIGGS